jgi:hypothetical protein
MSENMGWVAAVNETLAEKLEGRLLAVRPGEKGTRQGEDGKDIPVTYCMVWDISNDEPVMMDHKAPFGWTVVRQQLDKATPENPWIIGRLKKQGRAFVMESPKVTEVSAITDRLGRVGALIPLLEIAEEVTDEEAF